MWKLYNKLFGWDYIGWQNSADSGVARVRIDGMGRAYYFRYKLTKVIDYVHEPKQVVWLTCRPGKYVGNILEGC